MKNPSRKKRTAKLPAEVLKKIEELKAKHKLTEINVISCDGKYCFLKTPTRKIYKLVLSVCENRIEEAETILENCWLDGDEEFKTDDVIFLSAINDITDLVKFKETQLGKY